MSTKRYDLTELRLYNCCAGCAITNGKKKRKIGDKEYNRRGKLRKMAGMNEGEMRKEKGARGFISQMLMWFVWWCCTVQDVSWSHNDVVAASSANCESVT
jgi:hypothetical protein